MLNLVQHLVFYSQSNEIPKQVRDDKRVFGKELYTVYEITNYSLLIIN